MNTDLQQSTPSPTYQPNTESNSDNNEFDLLALFSVLLRGWKTIILLMLLGLILGLLYSRYVNPTYRADALIQIDDKSQGVSALGENISELIGTQDSKAQAEIELIRSRMIIQPVIEQLHLQIELEDEDVSFIDRIINDSNNTQINTPEGVALKTSNGTVAINQFDVSQDYLNESFTLIKDDTGFILSNEFEDFRGDFNTLNKFKGVEGQIHIDIAELPKDGHSVEITKKSLQTTLIDVNEVLSVFERGKQTGIIELSMTGKDEEQVSLILREIMISYVEQNQSRGSEETTRTIQFMETQIPILKQRLEDSESLFNDFRKEYGTIDVAQEAELLLKENAEINKQLSELKLKRAELTTYYTEEHPLVIQINDQIEVLEAREQQIDNTIEGLPELQREFLKLSEDTEINREIYLTMLKNYQQLQIAKAGQIGFARIIDLPISTFKPIAPKKLLIVAASTLLGAMLGAILVLLKNLLRNVVKDPQRIEAKTGVPVVATVPRSPLVTQLRKNKKSSNRLLAYTDSNSLSYEAIKSLRTNLMFGMPVTGKGDKRAKVILITGESPGVGKSFISSNLSEVFSQLDKKVLIIDADMRLGELHKVFSIDTNNGLADYFKQEDSSLVEIVHPTSMHNVDFIPRGQEPNNPTSLLASEKFKSLMTELNLHYDYIIIDTPPILAASDAMILSQYADKVLMVTRYDKSIEGQVIYAIRQMNKANIKVDGIILNDVQQGLMSKYSYHYSYAYGNNG